MSEFEAAWNVSSFHKLHLCEHQHDSRDNHGSIVKFFFPKQFKFSLRVLSVALIVT